MASLFGSAYQAFSTRHGTHYTADANGQISGVAAGDVDDLIKAGATTGAQIFGTALSLLETGRNTDGSALAASASAGKFGQSITLGTSANVVGEAAQSNTKTDDLLVAYVLPKTYIAGANITVTVNAKVAGSGTPGTATLAVKAYRTANDGTQGSNIGPSAQNLTTTATDYAFTITGTTLNPGDRVILELETVIQETGGSSSISSQINSVRLA